MYYIYQIFNKIFYLIKLSNYIIKLYYSTITIIYTIYTIVIVIVIVTDGGGEQPNAANQLKNLLLMDSQTVLTTT